MIAIGSDHAGFRYKTKICQWLDIAGIEYKDAGTFSEESCDYPVIASEVAGLITSGECERGILICGTGIGMCVAANKVNGIRAALCTDTFMARLCRTHNDANILCLGERVIGIGIALDVVDEYLNPENLFEGGRHEGRLGQIGKLEKQG